MEISFYQLKVTPLEKTLPRLLEKAYDVGKRVLVVADAKNLKNLDDTIWTYSSAKFLPHGTKNPEIQPIFLSEKIDNDNREVLAITNGAEYDGNQGFEKVLDVFDGNYPEQLDSARNRWKNYKSKGIALKYWYQDEAGKWLEKAL